MKERYDYYEAVLEDVKQELINYAVEEWKEDREGLEEKLNEDFWACDSVTGNGSGSYTFSRYEAEENLCHNLDILGEALEEFGSGPEYLIENGPEACDVTIRCYYLSQAISEALDELEEAGVFDAEEESYEIL